MIVNALRMLAQDARDGRVDFDPQELETLASVIAVLQNTRDVEIHIYPDGSLSACSLTHWHRDSALELALATLLNL